MHPQLLHERGSPVAPVAGRAIAAAISRSRLCRLDASADLEARWRTIEAKILAATHLLERAGALSQKDDRGGPIWRLRFRERLPTGILIERTIRIGKNPELVRRASELLERIHRRGAWRKEIAALARLSTVVSATIARGSRNVCGSRRKAN